MTQGDLPLDSIQWTFQGHDTLNSLKGVQISRVGQKSSILTIEVDYSHSGVYSCVVSNPAGTDTHSAQLVVMGKLRAWLSTRIINPYLSGLHGATSE